MIFLGYANVSASTGAYIAIPGTSQSISEDDLLTAVVAFKGFDCCSLVQGAIDSQRAILKKYIRDMVNAALGPLAANDPTAIAGYRNCAKLKDQGKGATCGEAFVATIHLANNLVTESGGFNYSGAINTLVSLGTHYLVELIGNIIGFAEKFVDRLLKKLQTAICGGKCGSGGGAKPAPTSSSSSATATTPGSRNTALITLNLTADARAALARTALALQTAQQTKAQAPAKRKAPLFVAGTITLAFGGAAWWLFTRRP